MKPQDKIFFIDEERALFKSIKSGEISLSKFVEILNEKYQSNHPYKEEVDKDRIVEISKPQISMIPESSMREIDALVELTGQNKSAVIAGLWLRFGEVQTLKIENKWLHKLLESKQEAGMKEDSIKEDELWDEVMQEMGFYSSQLDNIKSKFHLNRKV